MFTRTKLRMLHEIEAAGHSTALKPDVDPAAEGNGGWLSVPFAATCSVCIFFLKASIWGS